MSIPLTDPEDETDPLLTPPPQRHSRRVLFRRFQHFHLKFIPQYENVRKPFPRKSKPAQRKHPDLL